MSANRYHNKQLGFSIEMPYGWHEHKGLLAWLLNWYGEVAVRFVPRGNTYPHMAICVLETRMTAADDVAKLMINVARSMQVKVVRQEKVCIGGQAGFAVLYKQSDRPGEIEFYKAEVVLNGRKYLFQFSSENFMED